MGSSKDHFLTALLVHNDPPVGRLREYEEAVYQFKPHLEELERINQQIQVNRRTNIKWFQEKCQFDRLIDAIRDC